MESFGFISPYLQATAHWKRWEWLPERWRFRSGFPTAGILYGRLGEEKLEGWGWKIPPGFRQNWKNDEQHRLWRAFGEELIEKNVGVVGVEELPEDLIETDFLPAVSDGKSLELLLFSERFEVILEYYGVNPRKAEIVVIWEEGNLGIACARMIAPYIRFLRMIHPDMKRLDQAAALIMAESGISPVLQTTIPELDHKSRWIVQCGSISKYRDWNGSNGTPGWELFSGRHDLFLQLQSYPISTLNDKFISLPTVSVLGETLIRAFTGDRNGHWFGNNILIEHVLHLKKLLEDLGMIEGYRNG